LLLFLFSLYPGILHFVFALLQPIFDIILVHNLAFGIDFVSGAKLILQALYYGGFLLDQSLEMVKLNGDIGIELPLLGLHVLGCRDMDKMFGEEI